MSNKNDGLKFLVTAFVFSCTLFYRTIVDILKRKKLENRSTQKIQAASVGIVELEGLAWPETEILTDSAQTPYAFECIVLQKYVKQNTRRYNGNGFQDNWTEVARIVRPENFLLIDTTGVVRVFVEDLDLVFLKSYNSDNHEQYSSLFRSHIQTGNFLVNEYRYVVYQVPVASLVTIQGYFNPLNENVYQYIKVTESLIQFKKKFLGLLSGNPYALKLFDQNKDGKISAEEIRAVSRNLVRLKNENISPVQITDKGEMFDRIYGAVSANNEKLIITDIPQKYYLAENGLRLKLKLVLSIIAISLLVIIIIKVN